LASEDLESGEPTDHIQESARQVREHHPFSALHRLLGEADEDHEDRDQRQRDDHKDAAHHVLQEDCGDHEWRRDCREDELGQEEGEITVEDIEGWASRGDDIHPIAPAEPAGVEPSDPRNEATA